MLAKKDEKQVLSILICQSDHYHDNRFYHDNQIDDDTFLSSLFYLVIYRTKESKYLVSVWRFREFNFAKEMIYIDLNLGKHVSCISFLNNQHFIKKNLL